MSRSKSFSLIADRFCPLSYMNFIVQMKPCLGGELEALNTTNRQFEALRHGLALCQRIDQHRPACFKVRYTTGLE